MFTGIIEECGKISNISSSEITIYCKTVLEQTQIGDSIAVNGVCLTVTSLNSSSFTADISNETFKITTLKNAKINDFVNLERAMSANGRFGGHMVSGHIDGIAKIVEISKKNDFYDFQFELGKELSKYVIKKGSISINGISLTIAEVNDNIIKAAVIPHTYENTNLKFLKTNDFVNIEVDLVAKYIEIFLLSSNNKSRISLEFLQEHGF